jgi:6-phosphogluconolactonase
MDPAVGRVYVLPDPQGLASHVAEWLTAAASAARGSFRISLSGGSTPRRLYSLLASQDFRNRFPWKIVDWYWGDERFVPYDHPESNYRMVREALFDKGAVAPEKIHPIPSDGSPEDAAIRYEQTLREAHRAAVLDPTRPLFDVTLLGLGADGHTASLLPEHAALQERERWVAAVSHDRPEIRITMTYPAIESSRRVAFLVSGREKATTLGAVLGGGSQLPAARLCSIGVKRHIDHGYLQRECCPDAPAAEKIELIPAIVFKSTSSATSLSPG